MTNETQNNNTLYIIIIEILVLIVVLAFFVGKNSMDNNQVSNIKTDNNVSSVDNNTNTTIDNGVSSDIDVILISDTRCGEECNSTQLFDLIKAETFLVGANFMEYDAQQEEAKTIIEREGIATVPAVIMSTNKLNDEGRMSPFLVPTEGNMFMLQLGATFDPNTGYHSAEISCDNGKDDDGNGQIDCSDTACEGNSVCREEISQKLDLFVMGYCPYGEIAMEQLPALQETFGEGMDLNIHYIATKTGDGYTANDFDSLHGVKEVEENLRQICINKYYGVDKLVEYSIKRYENADNYGNVKDEPSIAYQAVGIDGTQVDTCATGEEGAKLLEEDIKIAQELGITASPTWIANNRYQFGGIDASAIQSQFCAYNEGLAGCENVIELESAPNNTEGPQCN